MAKGRLNGKVTVLGIARRGRSALMMSTALQAAAMLVLSLPADAQPAPNARPLGSNVVAGSAAISNTATNTQINQSSQRAAIEWQSFNVGSQQSVTFSQPSSSAVALNRVTGPDPSQIAGRIDANGQVIVVNQSGVNFYKGAQVNTAGLIVSTANVSNPNFMAGKLQFDQPGKPGAAVTNAGTITIKQAGLAALVAPQVANSGTITAKLGHVVLAGAKTATLDLYGDGLLSLDVSNQVTEAPGGHAALVTNTGVIAADGGTVQLTARAADGIVQNLVEAGGRIRAATVGGRAGTIALNGVGGSILVAGQLEAPGAAVGSTGGAIEVVSDHDVTLASTARINASGKAGGGVVAIGTTLARARGGPGVASAMTAKNVTVQQGATVAADATTNGNGGRVAVLASGTTNMNGAISAKGGLQGGDGGFAEVSGGTLSLTGAVDLTAPLGAVGTLLLDPSFVDVVAGPSGTGSLDTSFTGPNPQTLPAGASDIVPNTLTNGKLASLGATANVVVQSQGSIDIQASVAVANALTFQAGTDLLIDRGMGVTAGGPLSLISGFTYTGVPTSGTGSILLGTTGASAAPVVLSAPTITLNAAGAPSTGNPAINLLDATLQNGAGVAATLVDISAAAGNVTQSASGLINAATLESASNVAGSVSFIGTGNKIANLGDFLGTAGNFQLLNAGNLTIGGTVSASNIFVQTAPAGPSKTLSLAGTLSASNTGTISLVADALNVSSGATIIASAGTVEIAPSTTGTAIGVGGGGVLQIGTTALGAIATGTLRLGGYEDAINAGHNTVTAGSIDVGGTTDLTSGHTIATTLRLDTAQGPITESGGPLLNVGTFAASTNSTALSPTASVTLGKGNTIANLGDIAVGNGDVSIQNGTDLTLPTGSTVYGNNVTLTDTGTVSIGGDLAAATGTLHIGALGSVTVSNPALIGSATGATIATGAQFSQSGGIVNAPTLAINAGSFNQSGGTIAALSTTPGALTISATGAFVQSGASSAITSNDDMSATGSTNMSLAGSVIAFGNLTLTANGSFASSGTVAAGGSLTLLGATSITQTGGLIGDGGLLQLTTPGQATQTGGAVAGTNILISGAAAGMQGFQSFAGPITVSRGSTAPSIVIFGADTPTAPQGSPTASLTLPMVSPPAGHLHHLVINYTTSDYTFDTPLTADWVEINTPNSNTIENPGGAVVAGLLTGQAGGDALFMQSGNQVTFLAAGAPVGGGGGIGGIAGYTTGGDFELADTIATSLTVAGQVLAGTNAAGTSRTLDLITQALTIDQSGTAISAASPFGLAFAAQGSLEAQARQVVNSGTTMVTPGRILLQTDAISGLPTTSGTVLIYAPDGMVEIAPLPSPPFPSFTMSVDAGTSLSPRNLSLTEAFLHQIYTLGTTAGTVGTQTLVLGSIDDGVTSLASAININTGVVLNGFDRTLQLNATGIVQEGTNGITVTALTGNVGDLLLQTGTNAISELGNVTDRTVGLTQFHSTGLTSLTVTDGAVHVTDSVPLRVVGSVAANGVTQAPTIALTDVLAGGTIIVDHKSRIATGGTADNQGSLIANSVGTTISGVPNILPSEILLQTDNLSIASGGTTAIVAAPSGQVAIEPFSPGRAISIDSIATSGGTVLSLGTTDLSLIDTLSGTLLAGTTPGPVGTQTLALGSINSGGSIAAGAISVSPGVTLALGTVANSLALYSIGDVIEQPLGASPTSAIAVSTLIGAVTAGNIYLNGANQFSNLGNLATRGGVTTPGGVNADVQATAGNVLISNAQSLQVVTNVLGSNGSSNYAEIDVRGGDLTVLSSGTVQAASAYLRAGDQTTAGNVTMSGIEKALVEADVAAGAQYTAATPTTAPSSTYGPTASSGAILVSGLIDVSSGTSGLFAAGGITEPGTILAGLLTGFSKTGAANLPGAGAPTANRIGNLGPFDTFAGFFLRDGEPLTVVAPVTDLTNNITIAVAPSGIGDLVLKSTVQDLAATGTVALEATGNVYESTGGMVGAATLVSQAGVIPDTEPGGSTPGTFPGLTPIPGLPGVSHYPAVSLAFDFFGNANHVATLGNVTATGNFLLNDSQDLLVTGTVLAGSAVPGGLTIAAPILPVAPGPFLTAPSSVPAPFAEIDVIAPSATLTVGTLTAPGIVHAGIESAFGVSPVTGNVTLRAGSDTVAGAVAINGGVFAANAGTVSVSAGYNPNSLAFYQPCGVVSCGVTITGTIWGDQTAGLTQLASVVTLDAESNIDESTGAIGAALLTGQSGGYADLRGRNAPTANRIASLGSFDSDNIYDVSPALLPDLTPAGTVAPGFWLRNGQALNVTGPVTDHGSVVSGGVWIAVAPPGTAATYGAADLTLSAAVTANPDHGTVKLQATGNVSEPLGSSGTIHAATLIAQAGVIPDSEGTVGNTPGNAPTSSQVISPGSVTLGNLNQLGFLSLSNLGTLGAATAAGDFLLVNGQDLAVISTVLAGAGPIFDSTKSLTITAHAGAGTVGNLTVNAGSLLEAGGGVNLKADGNISNAGTVAAGGLATLSAGTNIAEPAGLITAAGAGGGGMSSVSLTAKTGSISQGAGATISATNPIASTVSLSAATGIAFGGVIATSGAPGATGSISMTTTSGDITETAPGAAGPTGMAKTPLLLGSAGGNALFNTAAGNQVVQLGSSSTGAGNFILIDSENLTVTGALSATGGSVAITTLNGTDLFGNPTLGDLTVNARAPITASQNVTLSSQQTIANNDTVVATGGNVAFSAAQDITDTSVTAGSNVVMSAGGSISQNTGTMSAGNTVSLVASTGTIADQGTIRGTTVNLNAGGGITITGLLAASSSARLVSGGSINEMGTLATYLLTGSAAGDASLMGASFSNQVSQLGSFTAGGTFTLDDGAALRITGPVTAPTIDVDTSVNTLTLADQAVIITGGVQRPAGTLTNFPPDALTTQGAYFSTSGGFIQVGTSTILGIGGGPSVLRIDAGGSANITFDPLAGLQGKTTWLILDIFNGTAKGQIHVENLDVIPRGPSGSANLTGSVSGLTGSSAAGASDIEPTPNPVFQINSCPIHSVSCVLLPSESVPTANPLNSIDIGTLTNPNEDEDLLLPIVSDQDY